MILFLDDDVAFLDDYCDELKARGYEGLIVSSTDDAFQIMTTRGDELQVVVVDMMMPPGQIFEDEETQSGTRTGELFYRKLRSIRQDVPVVFFTNRNTEQLDGAFREDPRCRMFMKEELLPREFADMIADFL